MMCVSRKLSPNPASPPADYTPPPAPPSTQRLRRIGTTSSTVAISPPPSRHHHNHRSRRRSRRAKARRTRRRNIAPSSADEDQTRGPTTTSGKRDGWTEKGLDERKGSDEAAGTAQRVPPTWWRTGNRKRHCKFDFLSFFIAYIYIIFPLPPPQSPLLACYDFFALTFFFFFEGGRRGEEKGKQNGGYSNGLMVNLLIKQI